MIEFRGSHFECEVILWGVGRYVAYPISYRRLEEMMKERGVEVDHATLNRWVVKYIPLLEANVRLLRSKYALLALSASKPSVIVHPAHLGPFLFLR